VRRRFRPVTAVAVLAAAVLVYGCTPQRTERGSAPPASASPATTGAASPSTAGSAEPARGSATTTAANAPATAAQTKLLPAVARDLARVYVPNRASGYVSVVAEARARLDFRDPRTMRLKGSLPVKACAGINHGDYARDYRYAIFTCEFNGWLAKVDPVRRKVLGYLKLSKGGMPQDIRVGPGGNTFFVADMHADGVFIVDGLHLKEVGFIRTGMGAHGLYPSRDGTKLYVANRGTHSLHGAPHSTYGSVSVIDFATRRAVARWPIPGGGSPDMGNVSADGRTLWLSGRFDATVYAIDTRTGKVRKIPVGQEPHGLAVWPQPGRYSLGHTGIMRP
jgi:DNA-binding beta-propeller fold protein YncE